MKNKTSKCTQKDSIFNQFLITMASLIYLKVKLATKAVTFCELPGLEREFQCLIEILTACHRNFNSSSKFYHLIEILSNHQNFTISLKYWFIKILSNFINSSKIFQLIEYWLIKFLSNFINSSKFYQLIKIFTHQILSTHQNFINSSKFYQLIKILSTHWNIDSLKFYPLIKIEISSKYFIHSSKFYIEILTH